MGRILATLLVLGLFSTAAGAAEIDCSRTSVGLTPINDLGAGTYLGAQGGLYRGGVNDPPTRHALAGRSMAGRVQPLDEAGRPDPAGQPRGRATSMRIARVTLPAGSAIPDRTPQAACLLHKLPLYQGRPGHFRPRIDPTSEGQGERTREARFPPGWARYRSPVVWLLRTSR